MSTRLRDAAVQHLQSLDASASPGAVRRLTIDVEVDGRVELVTLALRDGELQCISSDGQNDGPHAMAALRFVAALDPRDESSPPGPAVDSAHRSIEPGAPSELADALDDLLTAVVRVGVDKAQYAPSVDAALERVVGAAPQPTPSGLGRFIGRLRHELAEGELRGVMRILDGASKLADALRVDRPTRESKRRIGAWLGAQADAAPKVELLSDRTMIEVGREWLSGTERATVERRYLIDVRSGSVFREDRPRLATASLGPCPRQLRVGLAEIEAGPSPRRIRVLQYEVQPDVPPESWEQLHQVASRSFAEVTERYRTAVQSYPTLAEPFVLVAPYRIEHDEVFKAFDPDGHQMLLNRSERRGAVLAFYDLLSEGVEPSWLAGRLTDAGGTVCLTPFAVGSRDRTFARL